MRRQKGWLFLRGKTWHVKFNAGGRVTTASTGTTNRREAERRSAEIVAPFAIASEVETLQHIAAKIEGRKGELTALEEERNPPPTLAEVWRTFMASPSRPDSGTQTLRQYASEWRRFEAWMAKQHPQVNHLHEVTRQHAEAYAADLSASKLAASTFNQHRNLLRMVWRTLVDTARLTGNPWETITTKKNNSLTNRKRALTPAQFDSLMVATETDTDLHDLLLLLAWTGLRLVDGVTLRWSAVDFGRGVISLAPQKTARRTGKVVHIPMFPAVRELLDARQSGGIFDPSAPVFPALEIEYGRYNGALTKRITDAFTRAGLDTTEERSDRARGVTVYGAHSLRHFFVTQAAAAGMPASMIKSITGHTTDAMTDHYVQIGAGLAAEIAARMTATGPIMALQAQGRPNTPVAVENAVTGGTGALLAAVLAIAARIGPETWQECRRELEALTA